MWQLWLKFLILIYLFLHVVLFLRKRTAESNLKSLLPHFLLLYFPALSLFSYSFPNLYSEWAWKLALPSTYYLQHCTMFLKIPPANLESKTCHLIFILLFMLWPCVCVCFCVPVWLCMCMHGPFAEADSLFPPCGSWDWSQVIRALTSYNSRGIWNKNE